MSRRIFLLWCSLALFLSCRAPHDNPLDPESDHYRPPETPPVEVDLWPRIRSDHKSIRTGLDSYTVLAQVGGAGITELVAAQVRYRDEEWADVGYPGGDRWSASFTASWFGEPHLAGVIGQPFVFMVTLRSGDVDTLGPAYLFRVIEQTPIPDSPIDSQVVTINPPLIWQAFRVDYDVGLRAEVTRRIGSNVDQTVWVSPLLPSTALSVLIPDSLASGTYYWTLTAIDSFENMSRSQQASFIVQRD